MAGATLVDGRLSDRYDYALAGPARRPLRRVAGIRPRGHVRFYALRLNEVGLIKSDPNKIIAEGTDWRFLNELKRELKT